MNKKILFLMPSFLLLSSCCNFSNQNYDVVYRYVSNLTIGEQKILNIDMFNKNGKEIDFDYEIKEPDFWNNINQNDPCIDVSRNENLMYVTAKKEGKSELRVYIKENVKYAICFQFIVGMEWGNY